MKKFLSKVGTFLGGLLGFCFVAVVLVYSFKSTFFHNVNEDVERKQEDKKKSIIGSMRKWKFLQIMIHTTITSIIIANEYTMI